MSNKAAMFRAAYCSRRSTRLSSFSWTVGDRQVLECGLQRLEGALPAEIAIDAGRRRGVHKIAVVSVGAASAIRFWWSLWT